MAQTKMKKVLKVLALLLTGVGMIAMLVAGAMFLAQNQKAETENHSVVLADTSGTCGDNLTWTLTDAGVLTISGTGEMSSHPWAGYPLRESVKSAIIENGVTNIQFRAFDSCSNLTSVVIGNSVLSIEHYAFEDCTSLTSVVIGNSVETIAISAFDGCSNLSSITIPNSVKRIDSSVFEGCTSLTSIEIPSSVTYIGDHAFSECTNLRSVILHEGLKTLEIYAFSYCINLESIYIPNSVESIGASAFANCNLRSISVGSQNSKYSDGNGNNCIIEDNNGKHYLLRGSYNTVITSDITRISEYAFSRCIDLVSIEIPNTVTYIGPGAFRDCVNLRNITLPSGITELPMYLFTNCTSLRTVEIPDTVTKINFHVFSGCSSLESIHINKNITDIARDAFENCVSLREITVDTQNSAYSDGNGCNCIVRWDNLLLVGCKTTVIPNNVTSIADSAFTGANEPVTIIIPENVTSIGGGAFGNFTNCKIIMASSHIPTLGWYGFGDKNGKKILVSNSSVNAYKAANNWLNYSNIIEGYDSNTQYTVTFENEDSTQLQQDQIYFAELPVFNGTLPTKSATVEYMYEFDGWNKPIEYTTENTVYTATYKQIGVPYIITYNSNYGVEEELSQNVSYSENFITYGNTNFERTNYKIVSWNTERNGSGTSYPVDTEITYNIANDITLYAIWEDEYTITYDLDGGEVEVENREWYTQSMSTFNLNNPVKRGYDFVGWTGSNGVVPETTVTVTTGTTGDLTYTANWTEIDYHLIYDLVGGSGTIVDSNIYHITDVVALTNDEPTRNGYTFNGWKYNAEFVTQVTFDAGNITVIADWITVEYEINYNLNGGSLSTANREIYTVQNQFTLNNPNKDGYNFIGWTGSNGNIPEITVIVLAGTTGDLTYTANWTAINYTITTTVDGVDTVQNYNIESADIILINPEKPGYKFIGWTGSNGVNPELVVSIPTGSYGDKAYTANWTEVYTITYNLDGGSATNPATYTALDDEIILNNPTKANSAFIGWTGSNGVDPELVVSIPTGTTGNLTYTAKWIDSYTITYNLDGGEVETTNPTVYTAIDDEFTLNNPSKNGYDFTGWTGSNGDTPEMSVTIPTGSYGDKSYTANWSLINYTITTTVDGMDTVENYNVESADITLVNPTKDYYDFTGWTGTDLTDPQITVTIPQGSTGNRTYTANWTPTEYTISYILNGGSATNPVKYTVESESITLNNPSKKGYDFTGWTGSNGENPQTTVTIPTGSHGNLAYTANWEIINYTITYTLGGGTATNPESYNITSAKITLNKPTREGYNFVGWTGSNGTTPQKTVSIAHGSTGNKQYTAVWALQNYPIQYVLHGGNIEGENPSSYNVETEDFTLINPSKIGYNFLGWTEQDDNEPVIEKTVHQGTTGSKQFTANWEVVNYRITTTIDGVENIQNYTIESENITLVNPSKAGYIFIGWTGTDLIEATMEVIIPHGSIGDRAYTANFEVVVYTITTTVDGVESTQNYTVESESITLVNPTKLGYTFLGWTGTDLAEATMEVVVPTGSIGNRAYTANWSDAILYTITYTLNGGTAENPVTYTVESESITLVNPTKLGYTFIGWTGTDLEEETMEVVIPQGSTGNREYTANFEVNTYMIKTIVDGVEHTQNYTIESENITLVNPSKDGYNFLGWTGEGLEEPIMEVVVPTGSTGDKTYTANFEEEKASPLALILGLSIPLGVLFITGIVLLILAKQKKIKLW